MKRYANPRLMMLVLALSLGLSAIALGRLTKAHAAVAMQEGCTMNPVVTNNFDVGVGSLRQAVIDACPGSTITFNVTGTISLTSGQIVIDKDLTIQGPGAQVLTVSNGADAYVDNRIFYVNGGVTAGISGLLLKDGKVTGNGAGINNNGTLTITGLTISNNRMIGDGGGIYNNGTLTVIDSTISDNGFLGTLNLPQNSNGGGGIYNTTNGVLTVTGSTISDNSSLQCNTSGGGQPCVGNLGTPGGGISNDGMLTVTNSTISRNFGDTHAGLFAAGGITNSGRATLNVSDTIFDGNLGDAGGIYIPDGTANISNSTFKNNTGFTSGGGIYSRATTTVTNSTFSNNLTRPEVGFEGGGGIFIDGGTFSLTNSTVSNNQSVGLELFTGGGGIGIDDGTLNITNSTITKNSVTNLGHGGGIYNFSGATVNVRNSIIAGNTTSLTAAFGIDCSGALNSEGHNIIGITNDATITGDTTGNIVGTSATPVDPLLGPLADNGGPTQTHALLPGSPAIDAGTGCVLTNNCASNNLGFNLITDQRGAGFDRLSGNAVDIGAFEVQPAALPATTTVITNTAALGTNTVAGQTYTVQWTVAPVPPATGTPTGNVIVSDGLATCTAAVSAGQCSVTSTTAGAKTVTAAYQGDGSFGASTSTGASHQVNTDATTTTITNAAGLATGTVVGQSVTVQWSVTVNAPGSGTPTGTVTVSDGANSCNAALASGQCSFTPNAPISETLVATYGGDTNFNGSASAGVTHAVTKASTTTTISNAATLNTTASVVGQSVTVQWGVTVNAPGSGTPTGTVTVSDGANSCNAALATGHCSFAPNAPISETLVATYGGDTNFNGSASGGVTHLVNKADTTTTLTNAASLTSTATVLGQSYTVNWSTTVNSPGTGTPTGTVTVSDGVATCSAPVATRTCSITSTTTGAKTITAQYGGDSNFNGSTSSGTSHTINKADTTTTVTNTASLTTATLDNRAYTVQWGVTVNSPGAGNPTGTVQVSDGTVNCSAAVAAGQCNLSSTTPGPKTITASYQGDSSFNTSTSAGAPHTVNPAADLAVTKGAMPSPVVAGTNLTYTINFSNNGPDSAQTVTVTDALPAGTTFVAAGVTTGSGWGTAAPSVGGTGNVVFSKATVANAETAVFSVVVKVAASVVNNTIISNSATVASATADGNAGNNTGTANTTVNTQADLSVTKGNAPNPVTAGTNLTYALNFASAGPSNAQTVAVNDALPAGTTFVSATVTTGSGWGTVAPSVGSNGTVTFSKATVAPAETATFTIVVNVSHGLASGAVISNTATVGSATTDLTPGNNTSTATAAVQRQSDLSVVMSSTNQTAIPGGNLTYTIVVANNGPSDAANVMVTDAVPTNTTFVSAGVTTGNNWGLAAPGVGGTSNVIFSKAVMAAGETATFSVVVNVNSNTGNATAISNTATATSDSTSATADNASTVVTSLFDVFIYDANKHMLLRFSSASGFWQFSNCGKGTMASGMGSGSVNSCKKTLSSGTGKGATSSVSATGNTCTAVGTATVVVNGVTYTLQDSNLNSTCSCPF